MPLILFHRHTPWQAPVRCSTNILAQLFLQNGFEVAYMQGIVHGGNLLARRGQWRSWRRGPRRDDGAWVFTPLSLVPHARRWPFNTRQAAEWSYRSCLPGIATQLRRGGLGAPDIIWSVSPGSIGLRRIFPEARFVFQAVDYYPAFCGAAIKRLEQADYRGADHVFVTAETLKSYIVGEHAIAAEKITVLGQGVFTQAYTARAAPVELAGLKRPLGIWVGVLQKGDPALFAAAAQALRDRGGSLVLIGPVASWAEELARRCDSVHLLGPRVPEDVPAYLLHADVGLMLYDQARQDIYRGQNPLKLYEFAAAGLSIVSTPHHEFAHLAPPVLVASTAQQVAAAVAQALQRKEDMGRDARRFAAARDWLAVFARARAELIRLIA